MKRQWLLYAAALQFSFMNPLLAQLDLGISAALNSANFNVSSEVATEWDYNARTGYGLGGVAVLRIPGILNLQVEPAFLKRGSSVALQNIETAVFDLAYIDVPVLFRFSLRVPPVRPYFLIGPDFSYLLSAKLKPGGDQVFADVDGNVIPEIDVLDQFERLDAGLNFGGGVLFPLDDKAIFAELVFALGFRDIYKRGDPVFPLEDVESVSNQDVQLKIGILFNVLSFGD